MSRFLAALAACEDAPLCAVMEADDDTFGCVECGGELYGTTDDYGYIPATDDMCGECRLRTGDLFDDERGER